MLEISNTVHWPAIGEVTQPNFIVFHNLTGTLCRISLDTAVIYTHRNKVIESLNSMKTLPGNVKLAVHVYTNM